MYEIDYSLAWQLGKWKQAIQQYRYMYQVRICLVSIFINEMQAMMTHFRLIVRLI